MLGRREATNFFQPKDLGGRGRGRLLRESEGSSTEAVGAWPPAQRGEQSPRLASSCCTLMAQTTSFIQPRPFGTSAASSTWGAPPCMQRWSVGRLL